MYKVETHLHTSEASACGVDRGADMALACCRAGYCAIVVTDHFFNGNTCIPRKLPWAERIHMFTLGYKGAKAKGDEIGLDVYFGLEYNWRGAEFLFYNVNEQWLLDYPEIMSDEPEIVFDNVHAQGGFIIHVHPFRHAPYLPETPKIYPDYTDAVEVINLGNRPEDNKPALEYAMRHKKIKFAGSDIHCTNLRHGGMAFRERPRSLHDIIAFASSGDCQLLRGGISLPQ